MPGGRTRPRLPRWQRAVARARRRRARHCRGAALSPRCWVGIPLQATPPSAAGAPQMYHTKLVQLFEEGAENPDSGAHAQLVDLLALKVRRARARPPAGRVRVGTHRMSQAAR